MMHEKMLQFAGNSQHLSYLPNDFSNMTGFSTPSFPTNEMNDAINAESHQTTRLSVSPVLPGNGNVTHNITRMLRNHRQALGNEMTDQKTQGAQNLPYSASHFLSFRHKALSDYNSSYDSDASQQYSEYDSSTSDMSISTERSISPYTSNSVSSSPSRVNIETINSSPSNSEILSSDIEQSSGNSSCKIENDPADSERLKESSQVVCDDEVKANDKSNKLSKKNARTNFTNEQVKALIKIFHETPYPDSEMMENIAEDLKLKEKQVKIWFQNKRARWRRRVNDNKNNAQSFGPTTPIMSQPTSFGYMPMGHMMTSPFSSFPGYSSFPWMQGYSGHHYMDQNFHAQKSANQIPLNNKTIMQNSGLVYNASYYMTKAQSVPLMSSAQYGKMPPQQNIQIPNRQYSFLQ